MPVWQKTPGRPSYLPVAPALLPHAQHSVMVWKAVLVVVQGEQSKFLRTRLSIASRSLQPTLGKHGHLQAGSPAPMGTPAPGTLPTPAVQCGWGAATTQTSLSRDLAAQSARSHINLWKRLMTVFINNWHQAQERWFVTKGCTLRRNRGCLRWLASWVSTHSFRDFQASCASESFRVLHQNLDC